MKRRAFLETSGMTAAALTGIAGCRQGTGRSTVSSASGLMATDEGGTLAGETLEQLRDRYLADLNEYKEFQHKYVVDKEYGGYCLNTDWDGPPITWGKRAWYEGRGTWSFMYLYNNLDPDPRHLEASRRSVEFVMRHNPEGDQFFPANYTRGGEPGNREVNLYGDIFIANGLAQYSRAQGNERYWDTAKDIVMKCVRMYDTPGYNATKLTPNGTRYVGHWFILLRIATEMMEMRDDADLKALADRSIDAHMNYHYHPDYHLHNEEIHHDMSRPDNELANRASLGHSSEVMWMTLYEAVRRKDKALFDENAKMFRRNLEVAWDDVYGGVFINLDDVENHIFALRKAGWGQMEDLIGLMYIIEHTGAQWAKDWFGKLHIWTMAKFPLKPYGLPLWQDYTGRKAEFVKTNNGRRAENLHYPRYLMLNLESARRIIERKGAVSNVFDA